MLNFFGPSAKQPHPTTTTTTASSLATNPTSRHHTPTQRSNRPCPSDAPPSPAASSSTPPPRKKPKIQPSSTRVVVTTTRKLIRSPAPHPSRTAASSSAHRSLNALPQQKRDQIIQDRPAAHLEKRIAIHSHSPRPPKPSSASTKRASSSAATRHPSKRVSTAGSHPSDRPLAKPRSTKNKRPVLGSSAEDDDDDSDAFRGATGATKSARASRAPSTPSKRRSVDSFAPHTSDSYRVLGREGVLPSYSVPRDILHPDYNSPPEAINDDGDDDLDDDDATPPPSRIQSCDVVADSVKGFGPFFNGLGDDPRAVLEYPASGQSEEYLLLVPRDRDEYDPLLELLTAVKTIVTNYLTPDQQKLFGSLDSLEISSNAGMILPGSGGPSTSNGSAAMAATRARLEEADGGTMRARSADLLDGEASRSRRSDEFGLQLPGGEATLPRTPRNDSAGPDPARRLENGHAHTAPVSPTTASSPHRAVHHHRTELTLSPVKAAMLGHAASLRETSSADSPPVGHASPPSSQGSSGTVATMTTTTATTHDADPILRSFTKARNRRDGPLFLRTLARFNAELEHLRTSGALERNIVAMGGSTGVPEGVWRLIQDQVYARTVGPRVEELGRYQAFSDNVYGELLPRFMSEIAQLTGLGPGKVFVDLGSGVGNLLVQTSLQTGAEAYGCEMMAIPAGLAERQIEEAKKRWRAWGLKGGDKVEAWKGDFGEHEGVRDVLRRADVVLVNNYAFLPRTNEKLSLLFLDLPDGAYIISLKPFVPFDFRLTERTLSSPLAILRVVERNYTSGCVSWADGGGKFYVHIVDRSLVRTFLDGREEDVPTSGRGRGRGRRWKRIENDDEE